jgi:polysaccharide deacetylase 2 family uncharacterized protein YibQ
MARKSSRTSRSGSSKGAILACCVLLLCALGLAGAIVFSRLERTQQGTRPGTDVALNLKAAPAGQSGRGTTHRDRPATRQAQKAPVAGRRGPMIALVIDDLGINVAGTRQAIALPAAVTLAFLPYPRETPKFARQAAKAGHQILLHMPMQPMGSADPGPNALTVNLSPAQIRDRLAWALRRVPGHAGLNNHEGSRFTADRAVLAPVMEMLAARHLFFLDSRTTAQTRAIDAARAAGVASASRDVFLDDVQDEKAVEHQLAVLESRARRQGVAIAIGHPHAATLAVLPRWIAGAERDGFRLINVGTAIAVEGKRGMPRASLASAGG